MAIKGLGTDIVEIDRIKDQLEKSPHRLAKRILTSKEFSQFESSPQPAHFLAKRFAAKEAAAKAFGTGISGGMRFEHIEVANEDNGKPYLVFHDKAAELFDSFGIRKSWLSLSDEQSYAVATVIFED